MLSYALLVILLKISLHQQHLKMIKLSSCGRVTHKLFHMYALIYERTKLILLLKRKYYLSEIILCSKQQYVYALPLIQYFVECENLISIKIISFQVFGHIY